MAANFLKLAVTESVRKAQEHYFGESQDFGGTLERDALTEDEIQQVIAPLKERIAELEAKLK